MGDTRVVSDAEREAGTYALVLLAETLLKIRRRAAAENVAGGQVSGAAQTGRGCAKAGRSG